MRVVSLLIENDIDIINEYNETKSERAATSFVRKYQNYVFAIALRFMKNYDDADDLTQEVFIKALNSLSSFKKQSSVKTWLYRITVNMCKNVLRKKKYFSFFSDNPDYDFLEIPDENVTPVQKLENKEFEQNFLKVLAQLPEKQRETFALRYFDDLSYAEISDMLGTSVGGLKANYYQAVKKITQLIGKELL